MSLNLINPDGDAKHLKNQWLLLNTIALFFIFSGLVCWFSTPFFTRNRDNLWHRSLRYLSMSYALMSGAIVLACSNTLAVSKSEYEALIKAEIARRKHTIAANLYLAQRTNTQIAQAILTQRQQEWGVVPETTEFQGVDNRSVTPEPQEFSRNETLEPSPEQIEQVVIALADNVPESEIIKTVLGYTGRRYQDGKQLLERILEILLIHPEESEAD